MLRKVLFILLIPYISFTQDWVDGMQNANENFYLTQERFNQYWDNRTIEKGKGWKQFKRWENFIAPRVFPDGELRPELLFEEYQNLEQRINQRSFPPSNNWTQVGPSNVPLESSGRKRGVGRVNTVAFDPINSDIIYIGAPAGGFWKTINGGQTWTTTTDFLTNLGVSDIAINPNNTDEIYIITGDRDAGDTYGYGLMKSSDGGLTFNTTGLSFNITSYYRGNRVLIDPVNTDIIIVASNNGVFRSSDAGNTFTNTFSSANLTDIEFHPTNSNIVYGASKGNTSIYKSIDNGLTWSISGNGLPSQANVVRACVAVTINNPSVVYALFGDNNNGFYGVYKSIDEGQNWTQQSNSPNLLGWSTTGSDNDGQAWYDLAFAVDPNNEDILFVGGVNCWKSTDGGVNWNLNSHWTGSGGADYVHADVHMLKYNPLNNYIFSCNDGGLYLSTDNGDDWSDISDGLEITQFYSLGVSQTVQDMVITGSQDNGTFLKQTTNWDAVIGGDGMECIIDPTNSNIMYGELYYGNIRKSTNGGNSFSSIAPASNGAWETPYVIDRNNTQILYAGYDELYKTVDGGNNWNTITSNQTNGGKIDEIALAKSNSSVIYFSDGPNIYRTDNNGNSWNNITNNLPYRTISYIAVDPLDENNLWITFSGYSSSEKVYNSIDGGLSWQNISGTLPNIPVNTIVLDENSSLQTLYIGTDLGVFTKDSTTSDWSGFNNNTLPNVIVSELEIQYQSNKLIAATYGRGLWSIDLQITSPPTANFFTDDSVFCSIPSTVNFTNTSFYSNSYYWDFGDGNTSTSFNPSHTYTNFGTYTVSLIAVGPLGSDSIIAQGLIDIHPANPCITVLPPSGGGFTQTSCAGTLYDVGGPNGNYYDNNDSWITISPQGASSVTLTFTDFDIESPSSSITCNYDYIEIFDGNSLNSTSLGQYCNTLTGSPGTITSTGGSITILLHADAGVNGRGFALNWSCIYPSAPPVTLFTANDTLSCNTTINFTDLSTNGPTTWLWDFGDGNSSILQNPSHTYSSGGIYDITLTTSNSFGSNTNSIQNYINILDLNYSTISDSSCGSSSLILQTTSSSNNIKWYSDSNALNLIFTGNTYVTPLLNNSTTFYTRQEVEYNIINGAPIDNSIGSGGYFQGNRHLIFNNYYESKLKSVVVYSNSAGNRTIELRNSSNAILNDTTLNIPFSPNGVRIYLNFDLPVGNNMQLGLSGNNNDLYRNSSGALFPYQISNIISITGTNASPGYYYFFYDWEIQKNSCESNIFSVDAIIFPEYSTTQNIIICSGDSVQVGSNTYTTAGSYIDTLVTFFGCDSLISSNISTGNNNVYTNNIDICFGQQYFVGNSIYSQSGTYTDTLQSNGCDSIINTNLNIDNVILNNQYFTVCDGDSVLINNNYYSSGVYIDTLQSSSSCDSIVVLEIINNNSNITINNLSICDGQFYTINNNTYTTSGSYYDTIPSLLLCDSVINTNLSVLSINQVNLSFSICSLDSLVIGQNTYNQSGLYTDTLENQYGCDSILSISLYVNQDFSINNYDTICFGEQITVGNSIYNQTGAYSDNLITVDGCDSVVNSFLVVNPINTYNNYVTLCQGQSITIANNIYNSSGTYVDTLLNINNCDSIIYTDLTINTTYYSEQNINICNNDSITIGNNTYNTSGFYIDSLLTTLYSCDSIITTNLIVSSPISNITNNNNILLDLFALGGTPPYIYQAYSPNGLILNSSNNNGSIITLNPIINGEYLLVVIDDYGCISDTSSYFVDFVLSISNFKVNSKIIKITNMLGQQTKFKSNTPLFYHFDDGAIRKIIIIE